MAGPFSRLLAYLIDLGVRILACASISFIGMVLFGIAVFASLGWFVFFVSWFLMQWFYGGFFETVWNGQTPGKRATSLRVLRSDGRPISVNQAVLRNLLRTIDVIPAAFFPGAFFGVVPLYFQTYLTGLIAVTISARYQRIGDLACGTIVVAEDRAGVCKVETPSDPAIREVAELIPANYQPSRTLAKAISHYVDRRRFFGPIRRREIASHVGEPLVNQLNLPPETNHDALLCAIYNRTFISGPTPDNLASILPSESRKEMVSA